MMTENFTPETFSTNGPVKRRTLVEGAAWTIPVVAVAAATPAAAASVPPFACPASPIASNEWTTTIVEGPGSQNGTAGWTAPTGGNWVNEKDARRTNNYIYRVQWSFPVVKGATYTFNWEQFANGAGNDVAYTNLSVYVQGNGTGSGTIYNGTTNGNNVGGPNNWKYINPNQQNAPFYNPGPIQFTATSDGVAAFTFQFYNEQLQSTQNANHNIVVKQPTLSCVPPAP